MNHNDLVITTALQVIRKQSPFCRTIVNPNKVGGKAKHAEQWSEDTPDWNPPEAGVAWAIYEMAVYDTNNTKRGGTYGMNNEEVLSAWDTAQTGNVTFTDGKKVNLLEALGIDPGWARETMERITRGHDTLKEMGFMA